nr:helix-turn-helix transcriptional regulator [Nocardiopsis halophila]
MADRAGVARSWLARVEAGHRGVELESLLRLTVVLDLTLVLRSNADAEPCPETRSDRAHAVSTDEAANPRPRAVSGTLPSPRRPTKARTYAV